MIGSGIFLVPAESARLAGSGAGLLLAWGAAGALTVLAAISCAELAVRMPEAGGPYVFLERAWGPLAGFLYGWGLVTVVPSGTIAAVAVAFARYLGVLLPAVSGGGDKAVALAVVVLLAAASPSTAGTGLLLFALGLPVYFALKRRRP
jgi:APA family basic amino acid/polyamine antiporter